MWRGMESFCLLADLHLPLEGVLGVELETDWARIV